MIEDWRHGQHVIYEKILVRRNGPDELKYWEPLQLKAPQRGIFLGLRTLANGKAVAHNGSATSAQSISFQPLAHFRAALISPSKKENPIYVPLNALREKTCRTNED